LLIGEGDAALEVLRSQLGSNAWGASGQLLLSQLMRSERLSGSDWWREQLERLNVFNDESLVTESIELRLPHVNFQLLLDAVVPDHTKTWYALNFGAGDGKTRDPTYPLFRSGAFGGLLVESDTGLLDELMGNIIPLNTSGTIHVCIERLQPDTVHKLLQRFNVPRDMDALKLILIRAT